MTFLDAIAGPETTFFAGVLGDVWPLILMVLVIAAAIVVVSIIARKRRKGKKD